MSGVKQKYGLPGAYEGKPFVHAWEYLDKDGKPLGAVGRYQIGDKKAYPPYFKRNGAKWLLGIDSNPRPIYGLDKLAGHPKDKAVFITEGEKSAAALQNIGCCAVSGLGGAQSGHLADWTPLNDYKAVYILPDNNQPGEDYAKAVYQALMQLANPPLVKLLRLPELPDGGDIVDWLLAWGIEWDGYSGIPKKDRDELKKELHDELKLNSVDVPAEWGLAGLAGAPNTLLDWGKPGAIETKTPPVQALNSEMIPEPFRDWLADVSHRMQTPPDFATVSAIVVAASIIGAGCAIRPKRVDDWEAIPNLWGACIGRPSVVLKSPSMKESMALLDRLQGEYGKRFQDEKAAAEFDKMANDALLDDVKNKLKSTAKGKGSDAVVKGDDLQKLKADYLELTQSAESEPTRRMFKTNETSVQSMTLLQSQNPRGILVERDELTGLLAKWETEQGQEERNYFLQGFNGNGSYTDFKIGRGLIEAPNICISLLGGIQPDKLKRYLYQAMRGNNDGLMQRLQLAVWPDEPKDWALIDSLPNKTAKQRAYDIIRSLDELDFIRYGAAKEDYDERPYFRFDDAGQAVFNQWLTELQTVKIQQEENPMMVEHLGKFRSLMPSLALIFHCIDIADGKASGHVSAQAARLAVRWCDYLESHARRIYAMAESPEHEAAVRLAGKIKAKALISPFTCKVVYDKGWHGLKDKEEVTAACNILIDENWLVMTRKPVIKSGGRPPLPEYHINPVFL